MARPLIGALVVRAVPTLFCLSFSTCRYALQLAQLERRSVSAPFINQAVHATSLHLSRVLTDRVISAGSRKPCKSVGVAFALEYRAWLTSVANHLKPQYKYKYSQYACSQRCLTVALPLFAAGHVLPDPVQLFLSYGTLLLRRQENKSLQACACASTSKLSNLCLLSLQ